MGDDDDKDDGKDDGNDCFQQFSFFFFKNEDFVGTNLFEN